MKTLIAIILTSFLITFISCKTSKKAINYNADTIVFKLKKEACFGKCPIIEMDIYGDYRAELKAKLNYKIIGKYETRLDHETMLILINKFESLNFSDFNNEYNSSIADLPNITIAYNNGKEYKEVKGKENRPVDLMELQFALEKVCDNATWNMLENYDIDVIKNEGKSKVEFIESEIIIEFKPNVILQRWIKSYELQGLRIINPISKDNNIWLFTYDQNKVSAQQIIILLKNDADVANAEYNKKINSRDSQR
jgi:hypothetical protein